MRIGSWSAFAGAVLAVLGAAPAAADSILPVTFHAPVQAFWGPGGTAAAFDESGEAGVGIGGGSAGIGFRVDASTGTVSGSYGGSLGFSFDDVVSTGSFALPISFGGGAGSFATAFGASMDVYGFVRDVDAGFPVGEINLHVSAPPFPVGKSLATSTSFARNLGSAAAWSGSTNFDIAALDVPPVVSLIEFGPTFRVTQGSRFTPTGIDGTLVYTHRESGATFTAPFAAGGAPLVELGLPGWWDFALQSLTLRNAYSTGFDGAVGGYFDVVVFGRFDLTTANFDLFDVSPFSLGFGSLQIPGAFSIFAQDSADPVPEPATILLAGLGLGAAAWRRRRRGA
ncbi:MAG: PEP-CTERM sorting domain-containing protein [Planctomycetota bacterium]